jgi:hypothetical protein
MYTSAKLHASIARVGLNFRFGYPAVVAIPRGG